MEKNFLSIEEVKKIEMEIFIYLDEFCKKNNIEYFMNYGTLLGAVRHKGYIPWDDDIDLMMSRDNYEKFIELFSKENGIYKLLYHKTDKVYFNNFIKIVDTRTRIDDNRNYKTYESGITIDIFPYDNFDDMKVVDKTYFWESLKLLSFSRHKNIVYGDSKLKDIIRTLFWFCLIPFKPRFFAFKIDKLLKKYTDKNGNYLGLLGSKFKENEVFENGTFDELIELEFEGIMFPAPKNYHEILTKYYGNYMELPPVEKQVFPHETDAYFI